MSVVEEATDALVAQVAALAESCDGGWSRYEPGLVASAVGTTRFPNLNRVTCTRPATDVAVLADVVSGLADLPHMVETRPGDVAAERWCRDRGLVEQPGTPLMVWDLDGAERPPDPEGVVWRRLGPDGFPEHVTAASLGFGFDRELVERLDTSTLLGDVRAGAVVGEVDGEPAVTGMSVVSDDWVGVYVIATVPAHRRRGLGAAVTSMLVHDAAARCGATRALLQSSVMGRSVYESLGFREVESWTRWVTP